MPIRKFLVASSVARLIQQATGSDWRIEGYLNGGENRRTYVVLEGGDGHLVLEEEVDGKMTEEDILVPRRHAEALLVACVGRLDIDRSIMTIGSRPACLDRIASAGRRVDLLTIYLDDVPAQRTFYPPAWAGREVSDERFEYRSLAALGIPDAIETSISNAGLEQLLDMLERGGAIRAPSPSSEEPKAVSPDAVENAAGDGLPSLLPRVLQLRQTIPGH